MLNYAWGRERGRDLLDSPNIVDLLM